MYTNLILNLRDSLDESLAHIEAINCGGCGHVALALHHALTAHSIPCELVTLSFEEFDVDADIPKAFQKVIDAKGHASGEIVPNNHIAIRFPDGTIMDSDGINHTTFCKEAVPAHLLAGLLEMPKYWNKTFNRCNDFREDLIPDLYRRVEQAVMDAI